MIPQRCWRSSAERFIESSALCGHFLSRKLNSVHKGRFHVKVKRNTLLLGMNFGKAVSAARRRL